MEGVSVLMVFSYDEAAPLESTAGRLLQSTFN
jgi:hypothetical protein